MTKPKQPDPPPENIPDPNPPFTIRHQAQAKLIPVPPAPTPTPTIPPFQPAPLGPADPTDNQSLRLRNALAEQARRKIESLRLYEPLPSQLAFHQSPARIRLVRGSNRSGKTLAAAVEVAMAVTGQHRSWNYPQENGRCFCVAKDLGDVGQVLWRKLGRAGAFKIIRDAASGAWRAYRPWDPADKAREKEARPAPPLIPARLIREIGWLNKREYVPSIVRLHNGWEISFFSGLAAPPQGSDIDLCLFDEEITDQGWFPEMSARLLDRHGRLIWSATPQAGTDRLYELHERAERERTELNPEVEEFVALLADNPHMSEEDKRAFAADLEEEEYRVRVGGEFAATAFKVYPQYNLLVHGVDWQEMPREWCRYLVVDPGHQVCAVLFAAVPPTEDAVYLYDELYLKECDAEKFGQAVEHKTGGQVFQAFLMDPHYGVHTEAGSGRSVEEQYADALRKRNIRSAVTGSRFLMANEDVAAGILAVHGWMRLREDGKPKLRILRGALPNLDWELKRYHKQRVKGQVIDKPLQRGATHLCDCLRYLAIFNPRYVKPRRDKAPLGGAIRAYRDRQKRIRGDETKMIRLGPGKGDYGRDRG